MLSPVLLDVLHRWWKEGRAYSNKSVIYTIPKALASLMGQAFLFKAAAETLQTIAADPKHLGARIGLTLVLHTWGSAMTHHPHVHGIVPGGGLSIDGEQWIHCRPGFFLPVRILSRLFRPSGLVRRLPSDPHATLSAHCCGGRHLTTLNILGSPGNVFECLLSGKRLF